MAEEVHPSNPAEAVAEVAATDGMAQEPVTIDQFWDENPLIPHWMDDELPRNRLLKDGIFNVFAIICLLFIFAILSMLFSGSDKLVFVFGIIMLGAAAYLRGKFDIRMARAQGKFIRAKMNEWRSRSR